MSGWRSPSIPNWCPAHSEAETGARAAESDGHKGAGTLPILDDEEAIRDSLADPKAFGFTASLRKPFSFGEPEDLLERHLPRA